MSWEFGLDLVFGGEHYHEIVMELGRPHFYNISKLTLGMAAGELCSAKRNFSTDSEFAVGPMKTTANIERDFRSQILPDAR